MNFAEHDSRADVGQNQNPVGGPSAPSYEPRFEPPQHPGQYDRAPGASANPGSAVSGSYPPFQAMPYAYQPVLVAQPSNGMGVAGFVTGLLGLLLCWVPGLGIVLGSLGVVLGGFGMSAGRKNGTGTGLALTGMILAIVSLVPAFIVLATLSNT